MVVKDPIQDYVNVQPESVALTYSSSDMTGAGGTTVRRAGPEGPAVTKKRARGDADADPVSVPRLFSRGRYDALGDLGRYISRGP